MSPEGASQRHSVTGARVAATPLSGNNTIGGSVARSTGADRTGLTHRQILTIMSGLMLAVLLGALDQTIVATAMRTIADRLHGQSMQAWGTTAYLITATITTPLYGKLSDIYGRKPLYMISIGLFLIGSLTCGFATSMVQLAFFRALQGLGAGGLMSLALAILADLTSPRERGRYQSYFIGVFGVASVLGPVIGGFFAGLGSVIGIDGWRWVFLVNLPIGLVALVVVSKVLNLPHRRINHKIDYWGAGALAVGLVPLLIVAEQGREWGWSSDRSLLMYGIGVVGLIGFVLAERRMGDAALLPLRLFRRSVFSVANMLNFLVGIGMFGGMASVPLYLQIVKGKSPTEAGLLMLPMMVGIMVTSIVSGKVMAKTGRVKVFPVIGVGFIAAALLLFSTIDPDTSLVVVGLITMLMGAGLGLSMQTLTVMVQADATPQDMGVATASTNFFRQTGGSVGTAVFLSILFGVVADRIKSAFETAVRTPEFLAAARNPAVQANPANKPVLDMLHGSGGVGQGTLDDTSFLNHLDPVLAKPFLQGFSSAMDTVFLTGGSVMLAAFVLVWFLKDVQLSSESVLQQQKSAAGQDTEAEPVAAISN